MTDDIRRRMFAELDNKQALEAAHEAACRYIDGIADRPVFPSPAALQALDRFDHPLPDEPGDAMAVVRELDETGAPATVAQIGGRYFGFVNGGVVPASLAARWLTDAWDQNTPLYLTSPIAARLESVCEGWLRDLFGLPPETVAGFVSGTSLSNVCALAAARQRILTRLGWDVARRGLDGAPRLRIIASRAAHATVSRAIALLGFGLDRVEWVAADDQGRIDPAGLPALDSTCILVLQAGNVNSGAFDDFATLCPRAREQGAWTHIDGAFGLWAAASAGLRHLTAGIEHADSWSFDGHKTLNTPYDNGVLLCRDRDALVDALQATGAYIEYGDQRDGMQHTPEMSRRGRVFELWAALKYLGRSGIDELVLGLHQRAAQFAAELAAEDFEIINDVVFNQVLVACGDDTATDATLAAVQRSGECWVGGTNWRQRRAIRISVCSWATTEADVTRSVRALVAARNSLPGTT
ncbi:MAG: aminotransferase class V-fold PLP-dependent enzyme [Gammaproteobacteria bacterium]|nr:aminotransferase class V-fold PLP-dependent enzyme [Gammaproteobacteria bacterium]